MIKAIIFDLDGTLTDTNDAHAKAWQLSFQERGFSVSLDRIAAEIGKGGDQFVESLLGAEAEAEQGDALRENHTRHYIAAISAESIRVFEGARQLIERAQNAGLKTALASSSQIEELEAVEMSSGVAWRDLFDVVVTSSDIESSKPAPDSIVVAMEKLKLIPAQCIFIGDTIYDAQAAHKVGVTMLGVETGPAVMTPARLVEAGAQRTYRDVADILAHFESVIGANSVQ